MTKYAGIDYSGGLPMANGKRPNIDEETKRNTLLRMEHEELRLLYDIISHNDNLRGPNSDLVKKYIR